MPLVDPVLVLADQADDDVVPTPETRELLMLARRVGMPVLVTCEPGDPAVAAEVLIDIARSTRPRAVLITANRSTEMISARVAVGLECAIVSEITDLSVEDDRLLIVQESAHGKDGEEGGEGGERIVSEIHTRTAVLTVHRREHDRGRELVLTEADVVVVGGRGVGSAEGFSLLARVAYALGGCLGGTHTAGELGWCPPHARISLPGTQIRPRLYLAGGVSGSVRHRSAIRGAGTVVAIDSDPDAPIFRDADFGIVGDLHAILPALLDELARRAAHRAAAPAPPTPPEPPPHAPPPTPSVPSALSSPAEA
jgi:electron transfer flavoprotein alpha subunit